MIARGIALAIDFPPAHGGIARLLDAWTADTEGVEWRIITTTPGPGSERVVRTDRRGLERRARSTAHSWLRHAEDRVVLAGHPYLAGVALLTAAMSHARPASIAFGRELSPRRSRSRVALLPLRGMARVVAISQHTAEQAVRAGARRSRVRIVRPRIRAPWLAKDVRERTGNEALRLVTLGRLAEGYKNLEVLLRACAILRPHDVVEGLTFLGDGARWEALGRKAEELGVGDAVELPGHLPDEEVGGWLNTCHVGLFPSRHSVAEGGFEGFGLAIQEMAAAGLPVLAGAAAGALDAIVTPWARPVDPDDLWAWVEAIQELYEDEAQRVALGKAALAWAAKTDTSESAREFARAVLG